MKKLSIIAIILGTAAATGFFVSKMLKGKKNNDDLFDDDDDCDCDCCNCDSDINVVIPDEGSDECIETPEAGSDSDAGTDTDSATDAEPDDDNDSEEKSSDLD